MNVPTRIDEIRAHQLGHDRTRVALVSDDAGCSRRDFGPALAAFAAVVSFCAFVGAIYGVMR